MPLLAQASLFAADVWACHTQRCELPPVAPSAAIHGRCVYHAWQTCNAPWKTRPKHSVCLCRVGDMAHWLLRTACVATGRAAVAGTATADPAASAGAEQPPVWPSGESLAAAAAAVAPPAPATEADALRLQACGHCIPHPAKLERGGEDAHFILGSYAIGVADGVGGWSKNGVDPGEYSRELMRQTAQALRRDSTRSMSCVDALTAAHDAVRMPGTCTAIVARCA